MNTSGSSSSISNRSHLSIDDDNRMARLSDADKREVQECLEMESQRKTLQDRIHFITGKCFQKCVTGQIAAGYGKLDRTERPCMENCVQRFVDVGDVLLQNIGKIGPGGTSLNRGI